MSEPKRVSFTTITNVVTSFGGTGSSAGAGGLPVAGSASLRFGSEFAMAPDKPTSNGGSSGGAIAKSVGGDKTIRLSLELFPSDTCSYPEFNYAKLLHLEKKKIKKLKQKTNGISDPFEDNDDDVARIAKELEKKYGSAYGSGRGSKKDDHCDIGLGYDESDSFIDNTEAYDEIVPEEVETIEGGFYINCGPLEFKKLHGESTTTKTDEIIKMPNRPKKRVLSSSSEDSSSSDKDEGDEANCDDDDDDEDEEDESDSDNETEEKSAPESGKEKGGDFKSQPPEKRKKIELPVVAAGTNGSAKPLKPKDTKKRKDNKQFGLSSSSSNSPKTHVEEIHGSDSEKERKTIKTTTVKDMLKAKRDNFLKMQGNGPNVGGGGVGAPTKSSDEDESSSDDDDDDDDNDSEDSQPNGQRPTENSIDKSVQNSDNMEKVDTILPFDLQPDHVARITQFSEFVMSQNMTGKKFQLDGKSMEMFVKIEESLTDRSVRTKVFAHLEYCFQLPKYYFLRKIKQMRAKKEKLKIQRASTKLRKAIMETMPNASAAYELETLKYAEMQLDKVNDDKPPKVPKKKFPWSASLRQLLFEVYVVRKQSFPILGTRKESVIDFVNSYLRDKIVELWPIGWMRFEELQREIEKFIVQDQSSTGVGISNTDEYDTITIGQSDTDSRASSASGTGHNEVRQAKIANAKKQTQKNKIDKKQRVVDSVPPINNISPQRPTHAIEVVDLVSPTRKQELTNLFQGASMSVSNAMLQMQQQIAQHQQQQQHLLKHSKSNDMLNASPNANPNIAVIDLDKLTSANDILETTKMMNAISASKVHQQQQQQQLQQKPSTNIESDTVEFVSIYRSNQQRTSVGGGPMTPANVKNKSKKHDNGKQQKGSHIDPTALNLYASNNNNATKMDNNMGKLYPPHFQHANVSNKSPKVLTSLGAVNKETNR